MFGCAKSFANFSFKLTCSSEKDKFLILTVQISLFLNSFSYYCSMKKQLLILLFLPLLFFFGDGDIYSQNTSQSKYDFVTFLDGGTMEREPFINACIGSMLEGKNNNMFKNGGLDYCNCFLEKLAQKYTLYDFKKMDLGIRQNKDSREKKAYKLYEKSEISSIVEECMQDPKIINNDVKMEISSKEMLDLHILQCKDALKLELTKTEYREFLNYVYVDEYCACFMQKITNEFTLKEMDNLEKRDNIIKVEKIQEYCILDNLR